MKKVAIVGVEGSGKTVMLAGLGDLYTYPDHEGYFLAPKNFGTAAYVAEKIERMRKGEWPSATAGDEMQGLDWTLERKEPGARRSPEKICEVSFLDFAGEVYRTAFGIGAGDPSLAEQAEELKRYVSEADELIVLINLRDVIVHGIRDRHVQEAMWITNAILDAALSEQAGHKAPRAAIVLSQADSYAETIKACDGAIGVLRKYLPHVANRYDWLDVFAASAVDKTNLDDNGNAVPAEGFTSKGLLPIMTWIRGEEVLDSGGRGATGLPEKVPDGGCGTIALPGNATAGGTRLSCPNDSADGVSGGAETMGRVQLWEGGPYWADTNIGAENPWDYGYYFWWGDILGYKRANNTWVASDGSYSEFSFENLPICRKDIATLYSEGWVGLSEEKAPLTFGRFLLNFKEVKLEELLHGYREEVLTPKHDAAQVQRGGRWRMPTRKELQDLCKKCNWIWTTLNGVTGYVIRGKGAYSFASIFLPAAGYGDGITLELVGSHGRYWSSVPRSDHNDSSRIDDAWHLDFDSSSHGMYDCGRDCGQPVRPVQGFTK